ncbi:N-acetylglucosamine-6-phosphate deacetylase [Paenibacillus hemerocallicola]|uniref:N-acetylglucosamine-6-phosphate deacetylase n=1 Tax=Paenibacillus hemerocallicola TaxID=1172614 RepID=A0A5C4TG37_9BACL|nr:N-acetylglucosamine-6-phosphate deacetylase [Paenibacillus hemerocallicola]TNJ68053.1 N-acetylglucosamine-6-phosphate deacetylase [Paenibacillus hemerocallicola]
MDKRTGKMAGTGTIVDVRMADGVIASVTPCSETPEGELPWISPGWIDLQVNGYAGFDFNAQPVDVKDVLGVTEQMNRYGVTSYLPTVITGSFERMKQAVGQIGRVCDEYASAAASIAGIHVEGPYLSREDGPRGAHPREHVREPDYDEWLQLQKESGNRIRMITVAPERQGMAEFVRRLADEGITVCIGHTAASPDQLDAAIEAGAVLSTHLGNGSHPVLARHPNYIWHQLGDDRLWASFIPDGHHLAPAVLKSMVRAKRDRFVLVTDCVALGGMPPGKYRSLVGGEVEVHANGRLSTADNPNILAGSGVTMPECVANAIRFAGLSMKETVEAITERPANVLGREDLGRLVPGAAADLTLFHTDSDGRVEVLETIVKGKTAYAVKRG